MLHTRRSRSQAFDITKSPEWRQRDAQLLAQVLPDLELIQSHGSGDFSAIVEELRREVWEAKEFAKRDFCGWDVYVAEFACRLGFERQTVEAVAAWNKHREPLRRMAAAVRAEADRIRVALNSKGAAA